jgi:hypothetical protein
MGVRTLFKKLPGPQPYAEAASIRRVYVVFEERAKGFFSSVPPPVPPTDSLNRNTFLLPALRTVIFFTKGSMIKSTMRTLVPMLTGSLRVVPPTRRYFAKELFIFDREALRASTHSLRHLSLPRFIPKGPCTFPPSVECCAAHQPLYPTRRRTGKPSDSQAAMRKDHL